MEIILSPDRSHITIQLPIRNPVMDVANARYFLLQWFLRNKERVYYRVVELSKAQNQHYRYLNQGEHIKNCLLKKPIEVENVELNTGVMRVSFQIIFH